MKDPERRRMILRRVDPQAPPSGELARTVLSSSAVTLLQDNAPSTLLVEGDPAEIARIVGTVPGWSALPVTTYPVPDARPHVRKPGAGR